MFRYKLLFLLLFCAKNSISQLQDGSFEKVSNNCTVVTSSDCRYNQPCTPYWFTAHGTPQIFTDGTAAHGSKYAYMWAQYSGYEKRALSEGFFTNYTFYAGYTYTISFSVRMMNQATPTRASFLVVAANGLTARPANTTDCYGIPLPGERQVMYNVTSFSRQWTTHSFTYTPAANGQPFTYNQLWIYPFMNMPVGSSVFSEKLEVNIDKICISGQTSICPTDVLKYSTGVTPETTGNPPFVRARQIQVGTSFGSGGTVFVETSPNWGELLGSQFVDFKPNFRTTLSATGALSAKITACETNLTNCYSGHTGDVVLRLNASGSYDSVESSNVNTQFAGNPAYDPNETDPSDSVGGGGCSGCIVARTKAKEKNQADVFETQKNFLVYPNPTHDRLSIYVSPQANVQFIEIRNSIGALLQRFRNNAPFYQINLKNNIHQSGLYVVRLITSNRGVIDKKIIVTP